MRDGGLEEKGDTVSRLSQEQFLEVMLALGSAQERFRDRKEDNELKDEHRRASSQRLELLIQAEMKIRQWEASK